MILAASPLIQSEPVVLGLLVVVLGAILYTSQSKHKAATRFYRFVPPILLCYFVPGILNTTNVISGEGSGIYSVASRYLLPASLILLIMGVDLKELWRLRRNAGIMFLAGTVGIIIGGPLAIVITSSINPDVIVRGVEPDATWRGLATVAGSWTGGSANMAALYEVYKPDLGLYSGMIALDVIVANIWLATILYAISKKTKINRWLRADEHELKEVQEKFQDYQENIMRIPTMPDLMIILAVGLGGTGLAHFLVQQIVPWIKTNAPHLEQFNLTSEFFWLMVLSSTMGILLSLTRVKKLEGVGASKVGSLFLYILIGSIGMQMNILHVFDNPGLLILGLIWIAIHAALMILMARILKANFFFLVVGSEANIGGAPTASIAAAAFHPSLIPVGVLLSIFGYAIGNYAGYACALLMQWVSS